VTGCGKMEGEGGYDGTGQTHVGLLTREAGLAGRRARESEMRKETARREAGRFALRLRLAV
jgi:hypothetical protein